MSFALTDMVGPEPLDLVWEQLNPAHCPTCHTWSDRQQPWWTDPYEVEGQAQIREILEHYRKDNHAA